MSSTELPCREAAPTAKALYIQNLSPVYNPKASSVQDSNSVQADLLAVPLNLPKVTCRTHPYEMPTAAHKRLKQGKGEEKTESCA